MPWLAFFCTAALATPFQSAIDQLTALEKPYQMDDRGVERLYTKYHLSRKDLAKTYSTSNRRPYASSICCLNFSRPYFMHRLL